MGAEAAMAAAGVERFSAAGNGPWVGGRADGDNAENTHFPILFLSGLCS
jgi:hypothetical protein